VQWLLIAFDVWGILLYVLYRYLQSLLNGLRGWAWIPIEQYSNSTLTIRFFEQVAGEIQVKQQASGKLPIPGDTEVSRS